MVDRFIASLLISLVLAGCGTQYFGGEFTARNSRGEEKEFLVGWKKTNIWFWEEQKSDPVAMYMESGARVVMFEDRKDAPREACKPAPGRAILFCGETGKDLFANGTPLTEQSTCGWLATEDRAEKIVDIRNKLLVTMRCRPRRATQMIAGVQLDSDYLAAQDQPYTITVRKLTKDEYEALVTRYKPEQ